MKMTKRIATFLLAFAVAATRASSQVNPSDASGENGFTIEKKCAHESRRSKPKEKSSSAPRIGIAPTSMPSDESQLSTVAPKSEPSGSGICPCYDEEQAAALFLLTNEKPEKVFDELVANWKDYSFDTDKVREMRKGITASFPKLQILEDESKPSAVRATKIGDAVFKVFKLENRRVLRYKSEMPLVSMWKGYYILVSAAALEELTDSELTGLVAHETGHLYFMDELRLAIENNDFKAMRRIEMKCDLISMMCLSKLGLPLDSTINALMKMTDRGRILKRKIDSPEHPSIEERRRFYDKAKPRFLVTAGGKSNK